MNPGDVPIEDQHILQEVFDECFGRERYQLELHCIHYYPHFLLNLVETKDFFGILNFVKRIGIQISESDPESILKRIRIGDYVVIHEY